MGYFLGRYGSAVTARYFCEQRGLERLEVSGRLGGDGAPGASAGGICSDWIAT